MDKKQEIRLCLHHVCHICDRSFSRIANLQRHLKDVENLKFDCNLRGMKRTKREDGKVIRWTKDTKVSEGTRVVCACCYDIFKKITDLRRHFDKYHMGGVVSSSEIESCSDAEGESIGSRNVERIEMWSSEQEMDEYFEQTYTAEVEKEGDVLNATAKHISSSGEDMYMKTYKVVNEVKARMENSKRLLHPMHYFVLDLTGRHGPSQEALGDLYLDLQNHFADAINYKRHNVTEREEKLLLGKSKEWDGTEEKALMTLGMLCDTRCENIRKFASEQTHIIENFGFWINATEPKSQHWTFEWGEKSLQASAARRNDQVDPQLRSRIRQKCDYLLRYDAIGSQPELLIGEVSGGLPAAANWKSWQDFLVKIVLGSRDCLYKIYSSCRGLNMVEDGLIIYAFQLHGMIFKLYAIDLWKGLWRVALVDECYLPVSEVDEESRIILYSVLKGMFKAVDEQAKVAAKVLRPKRSTGTEILMQVKKQRVSGVNLVNSP